MAYSKSIKDRLLIYVEDIHVTFCIISNDKDIVYKKHHDLNDHNQLLQELDSNDHLNQPFRDILLLNHSHSFSLFPHTHEVNGDHSSLFELGNTLEPHLTLLNEALDEEIEVHYTVIKDIYQTLTQKYTASKVLCDVSIIHKYNSEQDIDFSARLYAGVFNQQLQVHCYENKNLVYSNKYPVQNSEDVFYFMMLGAEVFKLNLSATHLTWLSNKEVYRVNVQELLKNYIRDIELFEPRFVDSAPMIDLFLACE